MTNMTDATTTTPPLDAAVNAALADLQKRGAVQPEALFLLGTVMDFEEDLLKSGFTFKNPNQTGECGCGESVTLKPADLKALAEARATH